MRINWKRITIIVLDLIIGVYLCLAFTRFNKPDESHLLCTKVNINIEDEITNGFLDAKEIKKRLEQKDLYPLQKRLNSVNTRSIEEMLRRSPFVKSVECYKTQGGLVDIYLTQRTPLVRVKSADNEDYYVDDHFCVMPNTKYTSDIIVATGCISKAYAVRYISLLSKALMANELWRNQIEQINVLPNKGVELVPRVGEHIIYIGMLPNVASKANREQKINDFVNKKMDRLEKFYKYGLSQAGWNKYSYINIEFDNQIICKRKTEHVQPAEEATTVKPADPQTGKPAEAGTEKPAESGAESPTV